MGLKKMQSTQGVQNPTCDRQSLARILDSLGVGVVAQDLERRIFFFNRAAERITGFDRRDVVGKDCRTIFGTDLCGEHSAPGAQNSVLTTPNPHTVTFTLPGGTARRLEVSVSMLRDDEQRAVGILAAFDDVTEARVQPLDACDVKPFGNIIGQDVKMLQVYQQIRAVADYDYPVHISGETGTGKELVANAIHSESRRRQAPLVPINCGALPEGLIESELFGHVRGAFSGAIRERKGRFELADGGSVFLDEVAELSKHLQVKLLRFLQEGTFERVGSARTVRVDVRMISATNKDLKREVQHNRFREDLFYRLNVIPIRIPSLRERSNDIPLLVEHFLGEAGKRYGRKPLKISSRAISVMMDYGWPGNIRELQNAIQFAIVKSGGREIGPADLPMELRDCQCRIVRRGPRVKLNPESVHSALLQTGGNKAKAARLLGVGRATLYRFLGTHPDLGTQALRSGSQIQ